MAGKNSTPEAKAASLANLRPKPINERPEEERKAICQKGQEASWESRKRSQSIRDIYKRLLSMECPATAANLEGLEDVAKEMAEEAGNITVYEAISLAQAAQAAQGNTRAAEFVRDSAGDKPGDQLDVSGGVSAGDLALLHKIAALKGKDGGKTGE